MPVGTRARSGSDPGQTAQTFETIAAITARAEWNAIPAQTAMPYAPAEDMLDLYLAGTATQLNPGDAIVIVGGERLRTSTNNRWDVRWLDTVASDTTNNLTHITWSKPLGGAWGTPSTRGTQVFAFRQRASLFGNNAPDPLLMKVTDTKLVDGDKWRRYQIDRTGKAVDLNSAYPKIVQNSWVALAGGKDPGGALTGYVELYNVTAVTQLSQTDFGISGKITRLSFDADTDLSLFSLQQTQVLAQSDLLALAQRPLIYPVFGGTLVLGVADANIQPAQLLAVSGKLQRVMIGPDVTGITFADDPSRAPAAGNSFMMRGAPTQTVAGAPQRSGPNSSTPPVRRSFPGT